MTASANANPHPIPDSTAAMAELLRIVAQLRHPQTGCPWDLKQTHQSLKPYMLEEAYEAIEAIDEAHATQNPASLQEELGDVLLQVVLHSQLAQEAKHFTFEDVCQGIADKLVRRHPHVFGAVQAADAETVTANWEAIKQAEKAQQTGSADRSNPESILKGISKSQPALSRALETSKRAVQVGFEWPNLESLWQCVMSEYDEFQAEVEQLASLPAGQAIPVEHWNRLESEMGDILFASVNLARHFKIDPEVALSKATHKFTQRFQAMERLLHTPLGQDNASDTASLPDILPDAQPDAHADLETRMKTLSFEEWDALWRAAKAQCQ